MMSPFLAILISLAVSLATVVWAKRNQQFIVGKLNGLLDWTMQTLFQFGIKTGQDMKSGEQLEAIFIFFAIGNLLKRILRINTINTITTIIDSIFHETRNYSML